MPRQVVRDFGTCLNFNGTSAYVDVGKFGTFATLMGSPHSISAWFKITDNGAIQALVGEVNTGSNEILQIFLNSNSVGSYVKNQLLFQIRDSGNKNLAFSNTTAVPFNDQRWHNVVFTTTPSANTGAIYLDGVSLPLTINTPQTPATFVAFEFNLFLGARNLRGVTDKYLNGKMDDIRFYSKSLSSIEAANLYYGIDPDITTLITQYKFDEGSGSSATDSGTGANTGTITNATYSTDVFMKARSLVT